MRAQHYRPTRWAFPLNRQLGRKRSISNAPAVVENQIFGAGVNKKKFFENINTYP